MKGQCTRDKPLTQTRESFVERDTCSSPTNTSLTESCQSELMHQVGELPGGGFFITRYGGLSLSDPEPEEIM